MYIFPVFLLFYWWTIYLIPYTKIYPKLIKDFGKDFGYETKSKGNKSKNRHAVLHQTKKLLHSKGNHQQNERASMKGEKIFANHISDKVLIPQINKEPPQVNSKKSNNSI